MYKNVLFEKIYCNNIHSIKFDYIQITYSFLISNVRVGAALPRDASIVILPSLV